MIEKWIITGDCHGQFMRFKHLEKTPNTAVIILGDVGLNYNLNENDYAAKKSLCQKYPFTFYCVKGNHEARPKEVPGMKLIQDEDVGGPVWIEEEFPQIRYFCEWGHYTINGLRTLVVGGAYSVDKYYRLAQGWKWFESEQLTESEMDACLRNAQMEHFDLVLTHTCPYSWRPTDLFLRGIDQSKVDNTMEIWMEKLKEEMDWGIWLYGHYHADRLERPYAEIFYYEMEDLNDIVARWEKYKETGELEWWFPKSPSFYMDIEEEG